MKTYCYEVEVRWNQGENVCLKEIIRVETELDHDKFSRIVRECLLHVKTMLEINDE